MNSYSHGNLAALMAPSLVQLARLQARLAATSAPTVRLVAEMQATIDANKAAMARLAVAFAPIGRFAAEMQARLDADNVKWKLRTTRLEADTRRFDALIANIVPLAAR